MSLTIQAQPNSSYQPYAPTGFYKAAAPMPAYYAGDQFVQSSLSSETPPIPKGDPEPYPDSGNAPNYGSLKTGLRVAGILAGGAAIGGVAGHFIGRAMGYTGMAGAVTGGVIGAVAPVALLIYALKSWN